MLLPRLLQPLPRLLPLHLRVPVPDAEGTRHRLKPLPNGGDVVGSDVGDDADGAVDGDYDAPMFQYRC